MNEHLRQRILRRIEALPDDRAYQILDYIEFLETKYADRSAPAASAATTFTKLTDAVEDRLRAGRVSASAIAETEGLMNRAASVLNGAMQATRSIANELASVPETLRQAATPVTVPSATPTTSPSDASSTAHETKRPGSGSCSNGGKQQQGGCGNDNNEQSCESPHAPNREIVRAVS